LYLLSQVEQDSAEHEAKKSSSCEECAKNIATIEKLRTDLHKAVSLRGEMEEEWGRLSHSLQVLLIWQIQILQLQHTRIVMCLL